MPRSLWQLIEHVDAERGRLPLIHTTDVAYFNKIRAAGKLIPEKRPEYNNELLLFFFYGRPSYRPNHDLKTVDSKCFAPICMIMNNELLDDCLRIMPCDSGALKSGLFSPPVHPSMTGGEEFELAEDPTTPMKLIKLFFGSEKAYFDGKPVMSVPFDPWTNLAADSYDRLIRNTSNTPLDERVSAIEIQIGREVELLNRVRAVVLPQEFLDSPGILDQIRSWGR
ncbi:MAG TPA: hypothetical protein VF744_09890 [Beijerinckiaceae bacterium]|jgi:hypothetical protein